MLPLFQIVCYMNKCNNQCKCTNHLNPRLGLSPGLHRHHVISSWSPARPVSLPLPVDAGQLPGWGDITRVAWRSVIWVGPEQRQFGDAGSRRLIHLPFRPAARLPEQQLHQCGHVQSTTCNRAV